jgi:hypothetical protein
VALLESDCSNSPTIRDPRWPFLVRRGLSELLHHFYRLDRRLRTSTRPAEDPWDFLTRLGKRKGTSAQALYASERLSNKQLRQSPLD